jgi:hypothetical protein
MYIRFPLSLRNVEDLLLERGIDICHETVRFWWHRFGPQTSRRGDAVEPLALAPRRGLREDQRRAALSLARRRIRKRVARELRDEN